MSFLLNQFPRNKPRKKQISSNTVSWYISLYVRTRAISIYNHTPYSLLVLSHGHVRSIRRGSDTVSSPQGTKHKIIQVVYKTVTRGPNVYPLINALQRETPFPEMGDSGRTHSTKMDIALPISAPNTQKENNNK